MPATAGESAPSALGRHHLQMLATPSFVAIVPPVACTGAGADVADADVTSRRGVGNGRRSSCVRRARARVSEEQVRARGSDGHTYSAEREHLAGRHILRVTQDSGSREANSNMLVKTGFGETLRT